MSEVKTAPMIITTIDDNHKSGNITVRPYFDAKKSNLGLEIYGLTLFDGVYHEIPISCIERNGVRRYLTGLDEYAPEIKLIEDTELREAKIKEIRVTVAQLERELASNIIDVKDPDFWNKVTMLKPNNDAFWSQITIKCSNTPTPLDPSRDSYDLIKLFVIEAGGFSGIATSYEAARMMVVSPKFYLDKFINTIASKTEVTKIKNKAISKLQELYDTNINKLFYVVKAVNISSAQYKKTTPNDVLYDNMDKYIHGEGSDSNIRRAAQSFLDAVALDMETLKYKAIIKDATFYKFIALKSDGFIYHVDSQVMLGRNVTECIEFLRNPLHDATLLDLNKRVEATWNK